MQPFFARHRKCGGTVKYTIENKVAIIKQGLIIKRLELDKITKVVWDRKINFFDDEKLAFAGKACEECVELSQIVFEKYNCEQIEFTGNGLFSANWRQIPYGEFERELHEKEAILKNALDEYRDKFDFELCYEFIQDKYNTGAALRVWAVKARERVTVTYTFGKKKIGAVGK